MKEKVFVDKFIKGHSSFRKTMVSYWGIKFWKVLPLTEEGISIASKQIKRLDIEFKNDDAITDYIQNLSAVELPRESLQWEIYIWEKYQSDKALIFGKMHHSLMDGLGFVTLLASIDGDKNMKAIPQMRDINFFTKIILVALSPFFFAYSFFVDYFIKNDPSPFKLQSSFTGIKSLKYSKSYKFEDLK